jgi:hypothetical protein
MRLVELYGISGTKEYAVSKIRSPMEYSTAIIPGFSTARGVSLGANSRIPPSDTPETPPSFISMVSFIIE